MLRVAPTRWRISHITALFLITGVCGLIDAACFLSLGGVFAEIMTGNLLFLCFSVGIGAPLAGSVKYLSAIAAFAVGASAGGRLAQGRRQRSRAGFLVEGALLVAALATCAALHPEAEGPARDLVVSLLAVAMGMQNALVRRHGVPDLATNVMTLTLTALLADSKLAGGGTTGNQPRRAGSIATFLLGATLGAVLTTRFGPCAPLALATASYGLALTGLVVREA